MSSKEHYEQMIYKILQRLEARMLSHEVAIRDLENIKRMVLVATSDVDFNTLVSLAATPKTIAIENGELLSLKNIYDLNFDDYDIVMNCVDQILIARKNPDNHIKLEECNCKNIGRDRLKLLRFMLENPKKPICEETISFVYGDTASMSPNALAKSIGELRKCLWQASYIITEPDWGESVSRTGSVYLLNDKYKYLVIRYQI